MYSSSSTEYQKFSDTTASQPPEFNTPTGIPVSSTGQQYYSDNKAEPRPPLPPKPQTPWSTGLCDCFSDVPNCCLTFWCPCITFGRIAEIVDKGSSFWKKLIGFILGRPSSRAPHRHILRGGFSPSYNAIPNPKRKQTKEKSVICCINTACGQNGALYTLIACVTGCPCCYSCFYRSKMRQQYSLHESPCGDCLTHCCCESCALCQEYRELKNRGFDMTIGWHGNVERQNRGIAMAPVVEGGMSR